MVAALCSGAACMTLSGSGGTLFVEGNEWEWETNDGFSYCGTFGSLQRTIKDGEDDKVQLSFSDRTSIRRFQGTDGDFDACDGGTSTPVAATLLGQAACIEDSTRGQGQATLTVGSKRYTIQTATIDNCDTFHDGSPATDIAVSGTGGTLTVDEEDWRWNTSDGTTYCGTFDTIQYSQSKSDQRVGFADKVNVRQGDSQGCCGGSPVVGGVSLQGQVACKPNQETGTGEATLTVGNKRYVIQSRDVLDCDAF